MFPRFMVRATPRGRWAFDRGQIPVFRAFPRNSAGIMETSVAFSDSRATSAMRIGLRVWRSWPLSVSIPDGQEEKKPALARLYPMHIVISCLKLYELCTNRCRLIL